MTKARPENRATQNKIDKLELLLDYKFVDRTEVADFLETQEVGDLRNRTTFLGESVLKLSVIYYLYNAADKASENVLSVQEAALRNKKLLAEVVQKKFRDLPIPEIYFENSDSERTFSRRMAYFVYGVLGCIFEDAKKVQEALEAAGKKPDVDLIKDSMLRVITNLYGEDLLKETSQIKVDLSRLNVLELFCAKMGYSYPTCTVAENINSKSETDTYIAKLSIFDSSGMPVFGRSARGPDPEGAMLNAAHYALSKFGEQHSTALEELHRSFSRSVRSSLRG